MRNGERILNRAEYQRTGIALTTKPGGSCDYCGQYIVNMFQIESADGRRFKVGSDCVLQTSDKGLVSKVKREIAKRRKIQADTRAAALITEAKALLADPAIEAKLAQTLNPRTPEWADDRSMLATVRFLLERGGRAGKSKGARMVIEAAR